MSSSHNSSDVETGSEEDKVTEQGIKMRNISSKRHMELNKWKNKEGVITIEDLLDAAEDHIKLKNQKRFMLWGIIVILVFVLLLAATVLGLSVAAIQLTKDTSIRLTGSNSRLLDNEGNAVIMGEASIVVDDFTFANFEEQLAFLQKLEDKHESLHLLHRMAENRQVDNTTAGWYLFGTIAREVIMENEDLVASNFRGQAVFPLEDSEEHVVGEVVHLWRYGTEYFISVESALGPIEIHCPADESSCLVLKISTQSTFEQRNVLLRRQGHEFPGCIEPRECEHWCNQFPYDECQDNSIIKCNTKNEPCICGRGTNQRQGECVSSSCFPASATVTLETGQHVPINTLAIGTKVLAVDIPTGKQIYSPVIFWKHAGKEPTHHLTITYSNNNSSAVFQCSPNHYVYKLEGTEKHPISASEIRVGDELLLAKVEEATLSPVQVTEVQSGVLDGYYAPLTLDGSIVVDGIVASCHSGPLPHRINEVLFAPAKWFYSLEMALGWIPEDVPHTPGIIKDFPPKGAWYMDVIQSVGL